MVRVAKRFLPFFAFDKLALIHESVLTILWIDTYQQLITPNYLSSWTQLIIKP